jgi:hypothetical protein
VSDKRYPRRWKASVIDDSYFEIQEPNGPAYFVSKDYRTVAAGRIESDFRECIELFDHHAEPVAEAALTPDELAELRAQNAKLKQLAKARRATIKGLIKRLRAAGVRA